MNANAAQHAAHLTPETVYGETPATPPFTRLRHTGLTLGTQRGSLISEELRPDRQIADYRLGVISCPGDLSGELSFGAYDSLLEAAFLGTWSAALTPIVDDTDISVNATDGFLHATLDWDALGFVVGMTFTTTGFSDAANNGTFTVATLAAGQMTIVENTLALLPAGDNVGITSPGGVLKAGVTRRSFSLLRHFTDIAAVDDGKPYHLFNGVEVNTLGLTVNPTDMVGVVFGLLGREGVAPSNAAPAGSTFAEPPTTKPLDAFTGVITESGNVLAIVTEFSATLENGLEVQPVVGSKFTTRPSIQRSNLTGSVTVQFQDALFLSRFLDETETDLQITFPDAAGNSYTLRIPRLIFNAGQPDVSGQGPIPLTMPFQAVYDELEASNITLTRVAAE